MEARPFITEARQVELGEALVDREVTRGAGTLVTGTTLALDTSTLSLPSGRRSWYLAKRWCYGSVRPRWFIYPLYAVAFYFVSMPVMYIVGHFGMYPGDLYSRGPLYGNCSEHELVSRGGRSVPFVRCTHRRTRTLQGGEEPVVPVLLFGGNAMNMYSSMASMQGLLPIEASWQAYAMSPPGFQYASRAGWTTMTNTLEDAEALLDRATNETGGETAVVFGWSLGSSVAAGLAAEAQERVRCVALGNPFTSMIDEVLAVTLYLTSPWIYVVDKWPTASWASSLHVPTMVLDSTEDALISTRMHGAVYEAATSEKKRLLQRKAGHMDMAAFTTDLANALSELCLPSKEDEL
jgi:pimeloyl-ACP methyl ester carboxylesterase